MLLKDLQTLATKLATGTLFHVEKAGKAYSVDYSALAKAIIEEYADSTVGGSKQSVQAAIGALNSSIPQFVNGVNQWNGTFVQGSLSSAGEDSISYTRLRSPFVRVVPGETYYMSADDLSVTNILIYEIHYYKVDKTWIKLSTHSSRTVTFTMPSDCAYIKFLLRKTDNSVIETSKVDASKIMLNISDSAIDGTYSAYEGFANQSDVDANTAAITALNSSKTGTITPADSSWTSGELTAYEHGGWVHIRGYIRNASTFSALATIKLATISGITLPSEPVRFAGLCGEQAYNSVEPVYVVVATNGDLTAMLRSANRAVVFNVMYPVGQ